MSNVFNYDVVIVGGGVAGISAAIYAKRAGRKVVIIERMALGGQLNSVGMIENYAGITVTDGPSLVENLKAQVQRLGIEIFNQEAVNYDFSNKNKRITSKNNEFVCKSVILALGSVTRELQIEGEKEFRGRGVSYCAHCDGNFFKGDTVAVVGSNEEAVADAKYLSKLCKEVYLISKYDISYLNLNEIQASSNVKILSGEPIKIEGDESVTKLCYKVAAQEQYLEVKGVFISLGKRPNTILLKDKLRLDENGFIVTDDDMQTSTNGVFACGDVRRNKLKQISTAVGEGALAGVMASQFCLKNN